MGVSNVNINKQQAINAIKANLSGKKTAEAKKPEYLKMTGSIFNAPKTDNTKNVNITELNTQRSFQDIIKGSVSKNEENEKQQQTKNGQITIDNAAEGDAAAGKLSGKTDDVKSKTSQAESDKGQVDNYTKSAKKQEKQIDKNDKKFAKSLQREQAQFKKENKNLLKIVKENEEMQKEVDAAQNELDSLMAQNSFSMGKSDGTTSSSNQEKIEELQTLIGSKVGLMQSNGKVIYSLQRSQTKTLTRMNKTNAQYIKTQKNNQKAIAKQQDATSGIMKFANNLEKYSALVTTAGETMENVGTLMIAASSTPWTAWMKPVGIVLRQVGSVAKMVGNFGQTAANITKTAAYAAEGNLMGAMTSAVAAFQTGSAAVSQAKGLKGEFKNINEQAKQAENKLAANKVAKEQVKDMNEEQLGGLSKKEMKKSLSNDLQAKMNAENSTISGKDLLKDMKDGNLNATNQGIVNNSVSDIQNTYTTKLGANTGKKAVNKARNATVKSYADKAAKTRVKSTVSFDSLSKNLMNTAAIFAQNKEQENSGVGFAPYTLHNNSKYQQDLKRMQLRQAAYA